MTPSICFAEEENLLVVFFYTEYPFEYGEVLNDTLDGVSMHPLTTKIQVSFLAGEEGNGSGISP
jgi:hypothetical protein